MGLTQVSEKGIKDGEILNADINASAAIAGSKLSPSFGSQHVNISSGYSFQWGDSHERIEQSDGKIEFFTGNSEKMTLSGGNLGIGTTSPAAALTITKQGTVLSGTGNNYGFSINPLSSGYVFLDNVTGGSNNTSMSLRTYNNGTYTQFIQSISGNETTFETAGNERMRITSAGKVGIGTTSPSTTCHVNGGDGLLVERSSGTSIAGFKHSGASAMNIYFQNSGSTNHPYVGSDNQDLTLGTNNIERMRIDDHGVVRVGNTHDQVTSGNTKRIALGGKASIWGWASGQINGALTLADNYYWDGSNNKAIESDYSAYLSLRSGSMRFGTTANTQTGGNNISGGIHEKVRFQQGGGISFNGDSATANALNDYEEGTFTGGINDFNGTYTANTGTYTKIGNVVSIQIMISGSGGSGSGSLILTSLPFNSEGSPSTYRAAGSVHAHTGVVTGGVQVTALMNNNENKIRLRTFQNNATTTDLNRNGLNSSGWELVIGMVYHTAS